MSVGFWIMWRCTPALLFKFRCRQAHCRVLRVVVVHQKMSKCKSLLPRANLLHSLSNLTKVQPEDLNLAGFTHVNFAFAFFDPTTFQISPMDDNSATLYHRFTALKDKYNGLQAYISVGGWSFTDPGPTRQAFSNMASTAENRQKFISGALSFMNTYGFDGVDLDWVSKISPLSCGTTPELTHNPGVSRCR